MYLPWKEVAQARCFAVVARGADTALGVLAAPRICSAGFLNPLRPL
jgi:hypothetical protein